MQDKTVLVADDNEFIRVLVRAALKPLGCSVIEAEDGEVALQMVEGTTPDAILLDVVMPRMNGFQVLEELRSGPKAVDCPIAMLTTAASESDIAHGVDAGADAYIVKPFDKDELRQTVREMLGQ